MEKKKYYSRIFILLIAMTLYLMTIIMENQLLSNIMSPIVAFVTGYFIWATCRQRKEFKLNWMLLALLGLSWGITDSLWFISSNIYGLDPEEMPIFMYLYLIPNILLASTTIVYFIKNIQKWYSVQLMLDTIITWMVAFVFLWHMILKGYDLYSIGYDDIINTFLYMFTDIIAVSIIYVMYSSSRESKLSNTKKMIISGVCLYTLADLYYIFLVFKDAYIPNSLIDFVYMTSIVLFGVSSIYELYKPTIISDYTYFEISENIGRSSHHVLLLLIPTIFYFTGHFPVDGLGIIVAIVLIHQILSYYVQGAIRNEYLLIKEKQMTEKLEEIITERTEDLVLANKSLEELSKVDTLTGLFNRRYFLEELDKMIDTSDSKFSIFYMDLDRFKIINDTHGHDMGDKILKVISDRLIEWKPEDVLIARLGGDEFAVIVRDHTSGDKLGGFCEDINDLFSRPIIIGSYLFNIGVSIGVSRYPIDAKDRDQLTKYADIAMYNAKKEYGGKRYSLYSPEQSDIIEKRHEIEILLRNVDFDKEFKLNFQPQFRIKSNQLIGAEALLRWNNPIKGSIPPNEFIPIAEEIGIILDIGSWVMNKAFSQICEWNEKYQLDLVMGINISPKQIDSIEFISGIIKLMESNKINPNWIDFEITESSAMNANVIMEEILTELSGLGINLSIDDFGTGYSSLSYIKRFDIDRLKIAKELIDNISSDKNALLIVKAIIMMAKGLGLFTIAEGVEKEEQLNLLRMLECDEVQGYYLGKPLPADMFEDTFLRPIDIKAQNE